MYTVKVSPKGWIVIPKPLRKKYNLQAKTKVQVVDIGGALILVPVPEDPITAMYGLLSGTPPLTEELLKERARDKEREERVA